MMLFCRKIIVNKSLLFRSKGPILLASNHPNSFLDSIIINSLFEQPIWSLARGDVFRSKIAFRILSALKMLPVYRSSEGVENLIDNYKTFEDCISLFRNNAVIMIFSEGKCINEWHLRPLRKGTARLALKAWQEDIPLQVIPVGINYSSFHRFGKNVFINFGEPITKDDINMKEAEGLRHSAFNNKLRQQLNDLVFEINKDDKPMQARLLASSPTLFRKIMLFIPAIIGWLVHSPLYLSVKRFTWKRTYNNDHFDSVLTGILIFAYPIYLLILCLIVFTFTGSWFTLFLLFLLPFTAWSYIQLKPQLDK